MAKKLSLNNLREILNISVSNSFQYDDIRDSEQIEKMSKKEVLRFLRRDPRNATRAKKEFLKG